ncbi:unannotated protein [freshwater metagenome]|uniref:Unannotated protein n=1 Tax=freshwater metagenome TaxID=449393 RepID=A0A6J6PZL9_9ZZZZ
MDDHVDGAGGLAAVREDRHLEGVGATHVEAGRAAVLVELAGHEAGRDVLVGAEVQHVEGDRVGAAGLDAVVDAVAVAGDVGERPAGGLLGPVRPRVGRTLGVVGAGAGEDDPAAELQAGGEVSDVGGPRARLGRLDRQRLGVAEAAGVGDLGRRAARVGQRQGAVTRVVAAHRHRHATRVLVLLDLEVDRAAREREGRAGELDRVLRLAGLRRDAGRRLTRARRDAGGGTDQEVGRVAAAVVELELLGVVVLVELQQVHLVAVGVALRVVGVTEVRRGLAPVVEVPDHETRAVLTVVEHRAGRVLRRELGGHRVAADVLDVEALDDVLLRLRVERQAVGVLLGPHVAELVGVTDGHLVGRHQQQVAVDLTDLVALLGQLGARLERVTLEVAAHDLRGHPALEDPGRGVEHRRVRAGRVTEVGAARHDVEVAGARGGVAGVVVVGLAERVRHLVGGDTDRERVLERATLGDRHDAVHEDARAAGRDADLERAVGQPEGALDGAGQTEGGLEGVGVGLARVAGEGVVGARVDDDREVDLAVAVVVVDRPVHTGVGERLRHGLDGHAESADAADAEHGAGRVGDLEVTLLRRPVVARVADRERGGVRAEDVDLHEELTERGLVVELRDGAVGVAAEAVEDLLEVRRVATVVELRHRLAGRLVVPRRQHQRGHVEDAGLTGLRGGQLGLARRDLQLTLDAVADRLLLGADLGRLATGALLDPGRSARGADLAREHEAAGSGATGDVAPGARLVAADAVAVGLVEPTLVGGRHHRTEGVAAGLAEHLGERRRVAGLLRREPARQPGGDGLAGRRLVGGVGRTGGRGGGEGRGEQRDDADSRDLGP